MKTKRSFLAAAALAVMLSACGGTMFREPEIELEGVSLGSVGLTGGTLLVNVRVHNPNSFSLGGKQLSYQLHVKESGRGSDSTWMPFADGVWENDFTIRGGRTETLQIPVEFTYSGLGGAATSMLRSGRFDYRASGTVQARTPLGTRDVPFRKTGTVLMLSGAGR